VQGFAPGAAVLRSFGDSQPSRSSFDAPSFPGAPKECRTSAGDETWLHRTLTWGPHEDAIGKRFKIGSSDSPNAWLVVVGVVGNGHQISLEQELKPEIYV
jgi:hypothetical protein